MDPEDGRLRAPSHVSLRPGISRGWAVASSRNVDERGFGSIYRTARCCREDRTWTGVRRSYRCSNQPGTGQVLEGAGRPRPTAIQGSKPTSPETDPKDCVAYPRLRVGRRSHAPVKVAAHGPGSERIGAPISPAGRNAFPPRRKPLSRPKLGFRALSS